MNELIPDYATIEFDESYVSTTLPRRVRFQTIVVLQGAARRALDQKIAANPKPQKLADGSLGWETGVLWDEQPLMGIRVKAKATRLEDEPPPQPTISDELALALVGLLDSWARSHPNTDQI